MGMHLMIVNLLIPSLFIIVFHTVLAQNPCSSITITDCGQCTKVPECVWCSDPKVTYAIIFICFHNFVFQLFYRTLITGGVCLEMNAIYVRLNMWLILSWTLLFFKIFHWLIAIGKWVIRCSCHHSASPSPMSELVNHAQQNKSNWISDNHSAFIFFQVK